MPANKYYVYVIRSSEGYRYTGMTEDLENRVREHNDKTKSFWTKRGSEWQLVYTEEFDTKDGALRREKWLKSGVGRDYLRQLGL